MVLISSPTMISKLDVLKDFCKTVAYKINNNKKLIFLVHFFISKEFRILKFKFIRLQYKYYKDF